MDVVEVGTKAWTFEGVQAVEVARKIEPVWQTLLDWMALLGVERNCRPWLEATVRSGVHWRAEAMMPSA